MFVILLAAALLGATSSQRYHPTIVLLGDTGINTPITEDEVNSNVIPAAEQSFATSGNLISFIPQYVARDRVIAANVES